MDDETFYSVYLSEKQHDNLKDAGFLEFKDIWFAPDAEILAVDKIGWTALGIVRLTTENYLLREKLRIYQAMLERGGYETPDIATNTDNFLFDAETGI